MPETSGRPAASFANPITSLMVSENICQHLITLIHLTWQNLAIWPLPCSVSILEHTLKIVNSQNWTHTKNESLSCKVLSLHHRPRCICLFLICDFIFWVFVTCMLAEALQVDRKIQTQVTACYTLPSPFKPKIPQSWLQKVTSMIAYVAPNHSCAHNYLSEGCMRHAGKFQRNKWHFLVMFCNH